MKRVIFFLTAIILFSINNLLQAQDNIWTTGKFTGYLDIGASRNANTRSTAGLNVQTNYNTNIQLAELGFSSSHGILFNCYVSNAPVDGPIYATGNTKHSYSVGSYNSGAGAIMYMGNGGWMDFYISEASTGVDTDVEWGIPKLRIYRNGNVGIGINTVPAYKLTVNGTISASEVKVSATPNSDFVFEPDYQLKSLSEVETFVKTNKHLPDIPSAEEFKQNGVGLGEMDNMLLQKIEELTLYSIDQNKTIETQQEIIASQQEQINQLFEMINKLKDNE